MERVAVECLGGPEDGAKLHVEKTAAQLFVKWTGTGFLTATYALAVSEDGRFFLRYINSVVEA